MNAVQSKPDHHASLRLLIVDDQAVVRSGVKKMILEMQMGFTEILEAGSGQKALELVEVSPPDIMLVDIVMTPGMSGLQLVEILRNGDYPPISIVMISAHDKFEYVKKAMDLHAVNYLLKPVEKTDLFQTLITLRQSITRRKTGVSILEQKERRYYSMVLYDYVTGKNPFVDVEKLYADIGLEVFQTGYNIMVLGAPRGGTREAEKADDKEICLDIRYKEDFILLTGCMAGETAGLINMHEGSEEKIRKALSLWTAETDRVQMMGVSDCVQGLTGLPQLYQQARAALDESLDIGEPVVLFSHLAHQSESILTIRDYKKITGMIMKQDLDGLWSLVDHLFLMLKKNKVNSREGIRIVTGVYNYLRVYFTGLGDEIKAAGFSEDALLRCGSLLALKAMTKDFLSFANEWYARQHSHSAHGDVLERVDRYIRENYYKALSLAYVANRFEVDYYYLSRLIKKNFGLSYVEYLTVLRLEHAIRLLTESDMKVYEIAEKVGYVDVKYFYRLFKRHYMITPEQYRKQNESK